MSDRRKRGRWVWAVAGIALVAPIVGFTAAHAATRDATPVRISGHATPVPISGHATPVRISGNATPVPISGHATPVPIGKATPVRKR